MLTKAVSGCSLSACSTYRPDCEEYVTFVAGGVDVVPEQTTNDSVGILHIVCYGMNGEARTTHGRPLAEVP